MIKYQTNAVITTRKQSLRRLCFYTCLSVILFTGGSASVHAGIADHPQEQTAPGSRHPPAQCILGDTANTQAVCILLECILVNLGVRQ